MSLGIYTRGVDIGICVPVGGGSWEWGRAADFRSSGSRDLLVFGTFFV